MKRTQWLLFPAVLAAAAVLHGVIPPVPSRVPGIPAEARPIRITDVRPAEVFPADFTTAYGFNLEAARVKELWLADGGFTARVEILEQTASSILFRVAAWVMPGRWQIVVLTDNEIMVEQGVFVKVRPLSAPPTG